MKRLLVILFALVAYSAGAQNSGVEVLEAMSSKIASLGSYCIDFEVEMASAEVASEGHCLISGPLYRIEIEPMMQGYDGEKRWVVDGLAKEVIYDEPMAESRNLFDNPTLAFDFKEGLFKIVKFDASQKGLWRLTLDPEKGVLDGIDSVVLYVDKATKLPTKLGYEMSGVAIYVNILKIAHQECSVADFAVIPEEGFEVVDFR